MCVALYINSFLTVISYLVHLSVCVCVFCAARAGASGQTQLLSRGGGGVFQPGTRDLAPAGLARLCGGLHLHHPSDGRECQSATHSDMSSILFPKDFCQCLCQKSQGNLGGWGEFSPP